MNHFEKAHKAVCQLVNDFQAHEKRYLSQDYSEAQARKDFIDKFFIALDWDVNHDVQKNPYEQEVKVEKGVNVARAQKRADYAFCLAPNYRDAKFFVEAKKPFKGLANQDDYFQTARYGWNAGAPLCVLTDFEEFHIIDCRFKPDIATALKLCHQKFHYSEYTDAEKFAKIYWLFSHEAIANNAIEKHTETLKKPTGKAVQRGLFPGGFKPIDEAFLEEIDDIRKTLAKSFKKNAPHMYSEEITEAVQKTIDRLVFIRFLEDKLIEPEYILDNIGQTGSAWAEFISISRKLDKKYNGIVFKEISIDLMGFEGPVDTEFRDICEKLSHQNTPYDFNYIPIHIVGSIYERFLGKQVHATAKRVDIEEKPEVRKAGGVYYTPQYIVRYIVENTIGKLIEGKTPEAIAKLRFADIACGSGSFLIGAYELLLDYHNKYYQTHPEKAKKDGCYHKDGIWVLSIKQKRNILLNNIYGVDIDNQAVEVTQLSLALKMLEDETTATANDMLVLYHDTVLPDLTNNIVCGNSLIGTDILQGDLFELDKEEERKLNPIDFKSVFPGVMKNGGFDAVIGNPPYVDSEEMVKTHTKERQYCTSKYTVAKGNWDMYCVFTEKAISVLNNVGSFGYVIPNKFLSAPYGLQLKKYISEYNVRFLRDYSSVSVFKSNKKKINVYPIVIIVSKKENGRSGLYTKMIETGFEVKELYNKKYEINKGEHEWASKFDPAVSLFDKIIKRSVNIDKHFEIESAATVTEAYKIVRLLEDNKKQKNNLYFVNTGTIDRYIIAWGLYETKYIKHSYIQPVVNKEKLSNKFPKRYKQAIQSKLILAGMVKDIEAAYDNGESLAGKSTTNIFNKDNIYDLKYLLALINSKIFNTIFKSKNKYNAMAGGYLNVNKNNLWDMPFKEIDFKNSGEKGIYNNILNLVNQILDSKKQFATAKTEADKNYYQQKCQNLDNKIDKLVYELYGLTEEEIKVVVG